MLLLNYSPNIADTQVGAQHKLIATAGPELKEASGDGMKVNAAWQKTSRQATSAQTQSPHRIRKLHIREEATLLAKGQYQGLPVVGHNRYAEIEVTGHRRLMKVPKVQGINVTTVRSDEMVDVGERQGMVRVVMVPEEPSQSSISSWGSTPKWKSRAVCSNSEKRREMTACKDACTPTS